MESRARPALALVTSLPADELEARLVAAGGTLSQARATAGKVIRYIFGGKLAAALDPAWDADALGSIGIGAWAQRELLALDATVSLEIAERAPAADGTERLLLRARDGSLLETVIIPGPGRTTLCISSQVGCARACAFCETGTMGLVRQLAAGEIVDQVRIARTLWGDKHPPISNIVFMGMGEPFDNLGEVARATRILTDDRGLAFARSRVTVSTVGVVDKLEAFFASCHAELAVSLNASDDETRARLMPVGRRFSIEALMQALERHVPRGHKVLFEYVLIAGVNDSPADADRLVALTSRVPSRLNVIPVNPGPDPTLRPPTSAGLSAFVAALAERGVTTLVRRPRGRDVGGACGQLAGARRRLELFAEVP
ncbi:MAG: 23S rRNA (adenine(2503)-C(2))-methyltransferase RlmN [Polyangiaceae bacterium]